MPRFALARLGLAVVLAVVCLTAVGCGNTKVNQANFDKISNGMALKDVEALLGPGAKEEGDGSGVAAQYGVNVAPPQAPKNVEKYVWENGAKNITVYFTSGKVSNKSKAGF